MFTIQSSRLGSSGFKRKDLHFCITREAKLFCMGLTQSHGSAGAIPIPPARGFSSKKKTTTFTVGSPVTNIRRHIKDGYYGVEFQTIEQISMSGKVSYTIDEALKEVNQSKNRYSNVLPVDSTRVKLKVSDDIHEQSDYINANYVQGEDTCFIATQGPLPSTFNDFWRMIWETKSSVILMLTKDQEGSRIKCDKYWPEGKNDRVYGNIKVELVSVQRECDDTVIQRVYKLQNLKELESEPRTVTHIQFLGWPDHGVPDTLDVILELVKKIETIREQTSKTTPIVIHCSAGIGRTGAFIAAHIQLTKLHKHISKHTSKTGSLKKIEPHKFDVYETVLNLRKQRLGMVQQNEQYRFIYETLQKEIEKIGLKGPE
eukprot:TRINITY_DN3044_c0_g7_i1.p1 TRINITY_DN3044_c0_g7~~TRINITY_DN3044_c0_g7_i1.p1  ORF type:complete len:372 (+),score=69.37 TRINITY_DN3044_c0_g7_i1:387-1502(+)